jgi:hypothetical protein
MQEEKFVGTWKLLSLEIPLADGSVMEPYGDTPMGMAMFDHNNNFVAQIMKPKRKEFEANHQLEGTPEEIKEAFEGYSAYFGTFEVTDDKTLVNNVEGSMYPNWIGGEQIRYYKFYDNFLELHTPPMKKGYTEYTVVMKWERVT